MNPFYSKYKMKQKIAKNFVYKGLGFPITLSNVVMVKLDNEWQPKIDVKKVAKKAIKALLIRQQRLTGNQVKLIRAYFEMTLRDFAKLMDVSHATVNKWEKTGSHFTKMDVNTEKMLRLHISELDFMETDEQRKNFYKRYKALNKIAEPKKTIDHLDLEHLATA